MENTTSFENSSKGKNKHTNILIRILKSPVTALLKVSHVYMNTMSSCSHKFDQNAVATLNFDPRVVVATSRGLARNFHLNSSASRAVYTKLNAGKIGIKDAGRTEQQRAGPRRMRSMGAEKRSYSFVIGTIGRIDEDAPCEFKEVAHANVNVYSRSKTFAVRS